MPALFQVLKKAIASTEKNDTSYESPFTQLICAKEKKQKFSKRVCGTPPCKEFICEGSLHKTQKFCLCFLQYDLFPLKACCYETPHP